ncbi:MAG: sodium:proton antiporter NhaD [Bacteroidota bacterium]
MFTLWIIIIFVAGYTAIAFEKPLKIDKAGSALLTGVLCWTFYIISNSSGSSVSYELMEHLGDIAAILFFLLGAMTIVELIDSHHGFDIITEFITTKNTRSLLFIITGISFFLSAIIDNLTTAIVMTTMCSKLIQNKSDRLWFAGMIIIAANAGGAWSPLGDVTTTMLWIGGQITASNIILMLILPSIAACIIPAYIISLRFKGKVIVNTILLISDKSQKKEGRIIFFTGIALFIFVPVFKSITHLPPFMGMLLSLGIMWIVITLLHLKKPSEHNKKYSVASALQKIDTPSILFFLGILLAVAALQSSGILKLLADFLNNTLSNIYLIGTSLGLLSAVIDNVPLVAASQGMYDLSVFPADHPFWEFIAFTAGTGGSIIVIGSAAGIAAMGIEKIEFGWYLKKISWIAFIGFASGIVVFLLQQFLS